MPAGSTVSSAPTGSAAPGVKEKLVEVDLSPAGEDWKGFFVLAPGYPKLRNKPGDPSISFDRPADDPNAPQFLLDITHDKLDVKGMKEWVTDWAKGFDTPGKIVYVTDKPDELEYSVDLKLEEGDKTAYGYGVEVKVGEETYSCSAPNVDAKDLPIVKRVCRSLAKK